MSAPPRAPAHRVPSDAVRTPSAARHRPRAQSERAGPSTRKGRQTHLEKREERNDESGQSSLRAEHNDDHHAGSARHCGTANARTRDSAVLGEVLRSGRRRARAAGPLARFLAFVGPLGAAALAVLALAALVLAVPERAQAQTADVTETTDCGGSRATTTCTFAVGNTVEGTVSNSDDTDYWIVTLLENATYRLESTVPTLDTFTDLRDSEGNRISSPYTVPPGKGGLYYVDVTVDAGSGGAYSFSLTVAASGPTVSSIVRHDPSSSPTHEDNLTWQVTFDEVVSNVDAGDFEVSGTTATLAVTGSGTTYDVTASGGDLAGLDGTVTLAFASGQNIENAASEALIATTPTGANEVDYVVDNTAPRVTITGVPKRGGCKPGRVRWPTG